MTAIEAAQSLVLSFQVPAIAHSIWVGTEVDPDTKEFVQSINIAVRPTYKNKIKVPTEHQGHPVKQVPWPKGA